MADFYDRCCRRRILAHRWQQGFLRGSSCGSGDVFPNPGKELLAENFSHIDGGEAFFSITTSCGTLLLSQTSKVLLQKTFVTQTAESFKQKHQLWALAPLAEFGRCYFVTQMAASFSRTSSCGNHSTRRQTPGRRWRSRPCLQGSHRSRGPGGRQQVQTACP
jgi:hypothetical protein